MKSSHLKFVPVAMVAAVLAACGGGGGGSDPVAPTMATLQGTVIDGAITGATVFLDTNNNQTMDVGEPHDVSTGGGKFSLSISGLTAAQVKASHIVTMVPATAKDSDDSGKTLAEAGKKAFVMMAPAAAYAQADGTATGAVVSPITTLVSHDMLSDGSKSLAAAIAAIQSRLGLASDVSLIQDPSQNGSLKARAQVIAAAIGQVKAVVQTSAANTPDRDALFAALAYLQQHVAQLQQAVEDTIAAAPTAAKPSAAESVKTLLTGGGSTMVVGGAASLVPAVATLLTTATQTTTSTVSGISDMLIAGSYSGDCLLGDSTTCSSGSAQYNKLSGTASTWVQTSYRASAGSWTPYAGSGAYILGASGWQTSDQNSSGAFTPDGFGGVGTQSNGRQFRATVRVQDASNLKFGDVSGVTVPSVYTAQAFPLGAKVYFTTSSELADSYQLYSGFVPGDYNGGSGYTSLEALVDSAQTRPPGSISLSLIGSNGLNFSFNETSAVAAAAGGGTVRLYSCSLGVAAAINGGCSNGQWLAGSSASYKLSTVQGQKVLRVKAAYGDGGLNLIFGIVNGKVLGGEYRSVGSWSGASVRFNKLAFDAILKAGAKPTTLN